MSMYETNRCGSSPIAAPNDPFDPLSGLPRNHEELFFTSIPKLKRAAKAVCDRMDKDASYGNQYLVVRNLPNDVIAKIDDSKRALGVTFRFMFYENEQLGIIKIISGFAHEASTAHLQCEIWVHMLAMGVHRNEGAWGMSATHRGTSAGKQPDHQFLPEPRWPRNCQLHGWPTLVIETGFTESLQRVRQDAKWWFSNSNGDVKCVLLVLIPRRSKMARLEKWEMVPTNLDGHRTRARARQLSQFAVSSTGRHPPVMSEPQVVQAISITETEATGAPLVLNFEALMCRAPEMGEGDIVINGPDLISCFHFVW